MTTTPATAMSTMIITTPATAMTATAMRVDSPTYLRECAEVGVLDFVGPLNAVVSTRAVARYLGGNNVLAAQARSAGVMNGSRRLGNRPERGAPRYANISPHPR